MRFAVLGSLSVVNDAGEEVRIGAARLRVLLAALLLRANSPVAADHLVDIVWDGAPPRSAGVTLRSYVMRLRHALGPAGDRIVTREPGYLIRLSEPELDVLRFESLCRVTGQAVLARAWDRVCGSATQALALWRATPLADVDSGMLREEFSPRLERLRLQVLEWRFEGALALGQHELVTSELRDLTAAHPLRERLHAQLMAALALGGQRAAALEVYQNIRRTLVDELGVEPGDELRQLQQTILTAPAKPTMARLAPALPQDAPVPRQLPAAVPHFAGRSNELETLDLLLPQAPVFGGGVAVVVVDGMAGVGKTALALHWAHRVTEHFPDGQLYANLRGFGPDGEPVPAAAVARRFLGALGVASAHLPHEPGAQLDLYRSRLAGRRMLVVLDNARDVEQVRPLVPGTAGCMALITSRNQLTGLVVVEGATSVSLDLLTPTEARDLLALRLGAERLAREERAALDLITLSDRLPLGLNIIAARATLRPGRSLAAVAEELGRAGDRLAALSSADPAADPRAVFSWSYDALSPDAARMFRLLAICPGPDIGVLAAASLFAAGVERTRQVLGELTRANLIVEHAPGRYSCHDLLRAYAGELAAVADSAYERHAALRRILDHYLHTARAAREVLEPMPQAFELPAPLFGVQVQSHADRAEALAWYETEEPVLLAAVERAAAAGVVPFAWQLPLLLSNVMPHSGGRDRWAAVQRAALAAAERADDTEGQAHLHRLLATALALSGRHAEAAAHLRQAGELFERLGDPLCRGLVQHDLANLTNE